MKNNTVNFERNQLRAACVYGSNGKLIRKSESYNSTTHDYHYHFDQQGRLLEVIRNNQRQEFYQYNQQGQRIAAHSPANPYSGQLGYDKQGRLIRAADALFTYTSKGALSSKRDKQGLTRYFYGKDTLLDKVILPNGKDIIYEYHKSNPLVPCLKRKGDAIVAEYEWNGPLCLKLYRDYECQLDYRFTSNEQGYVDSIHISPIRDDGMYCCAQGG